MFKPHPTPRPATRASLILGMLLAASPWLTGCGQASDKAVETAAEKLIEQGLAKDGTQAKVDISDGQTRITATDDKGRQTEAQLGGAKLSAADLGVPVYPGAQWVENASSRISTPEGTMVTALLQSADSPDKVLGYYREQLKGRTQGKQFMDMASGDGGGSLMLGDDQAGSGLQVNVSKAERGSDIQITHTTKPAK